MSHRAASAALLFLVTTFGCSADDSSADPAAADSTADSSVSSDVGGDEVDFGPSWAFVQITDAEAGIDCGSGNFPGADIDAIVLYQSPAHLAAPLAMGTGCTWVTPGDVCGTNGASDASEADGDVDGAALAGFVSLNGGSISCRWTGDVLLEAGMVVEVYEVTGSSSDSEGYRLRACADAEATDCGTWTAGTKARQTFPSGALLF